MPRLSLVLVPLPVTSMARRSFIFCDICNPMALRPIDLRRMSGHDSHDGRRLVDGRAWFDGDDGAAKRAGWVMADAAQHICPSCFERMRSLRHVLEERLFTDSCVTEILRDVIE